MPHDYLVAGRIYWGILICTRIAGMLFQLIVSLYLHSHPEISSLSMIEKKMKESEKGEKGEKCEKGEMSC